MQKIDYNLKMQQQIKEIEERSNKPKLLLHSCCAPCSSWVLEKLKNFFEITVCYYNPNIYPQSEYIKRKTEQIKLLKLLNINFLNIEYNEEEFLCGVCGLEKEKEGGARCNKCFYIRLKKIAELAEVNGFEYFGTTLTVSPHKNDQIINKIGEELQSQNVKFLYSNFKKENGYLNSINLSKKYNLYRQDYCGCRFSLQTKIINEKPNTVLDIKKETLDIKNK